MYLAFVMWSTPTVDTPGVERRYFCRSYYADLDHRLLKVLSAWRMVTVADHAVVEAKIITFTC